MIKLSTSEKQWIKLCKGHYDEKYKIEDINNLERLKPMYKELYQYDPNENPRDFQGCMFNVLFNIYMKIADDRSGDNMMLKEIISASFEQSRFDKEASTPIERVIRKLVSQIRFNTVINMDGENRYDLDIPGEPTWVPKYYPLSFSQDSVSP